MHRRSRFAACALAAALGSAAPAFANDADALRARHAALEPQLAASPFGRPLVLESSGSASSPQGEVHAVVEHPLHALQAALRRPADWCDVLILQFNIKRCVPAGEATLRVAAGRKAEQTADEAYPIEFHVAVDAVRPDYLGVRMNAANGPLGTSDYRLALEAVPLPGGRSFVRLAYGYTAGIAARLATEAYLATTGRDKVGFSPAGRDGDGSLRYVGGIRGVAERNTMRYFLAIEAALDALALPPERRDEARLRRWFDATERHPRQLHEMDWPTYLAMKRRELREQHAAAGAATSTR